MKKLVAIIGSPRSYNSATYKIAHKIAKDLNNNGINVDSKFFILSDLKINKCLGCTSCFLKCDSCAKFDDDMKEIEEAMIEADFIILGSPVYAHNVTGDMKVFIDRLSSFLHIMKFAGKYGVTISTSSSNGNVYVDQYLLKIMESLGIKVIDQISYMSIKGFNQKNFSKCINKIVNILSNKTSIESSELQEQFFKTYKKAYYESYKNTIMYDDKLKNQEALYWYNNGYFNFNSFEELFNSMKNI